MAAFRSRYRHGSRWWMIGTTLALVTAFMVFFVAASSANLAGSSFESTDGNIAAGAGAEDWSNAVNRAGQNDDPSGNTDNAFGQGAKEDNAATTIVAGSIPPNKSDLTRFYEAHEKLASNGHTYLYLAWERANTLGSANMDFELNQNPTQGFTGSTLGSITINRTAGDLLITYDFTNGGANPVLGMLTWVTQGSTAQCFSSSSLPCWGNRVDLSAAGFADGSINATTITDNLSNPSVTLPGSTFGEAAIDLSRAIPNAFGPNVASCTSFGSVFLKSRSSTSFSAEVKDFVAPQSVSVSNCGYVLVKKTAGDTGALQGGASFTITPGKTTSGGTTDASDPVPGVTGQAGWYCVDNLLLGTTYSVKETAAPTGYTVPSPDTHSGLSPTAGGCADVSYSPTAPTPTTSFVDPLVLGHVLIHKTAGDTGVDQAGASFTITPGKVTAGGTNASDSVPGVTGQAGWYCVDNLRLSSTFSVQETAAPAGYSVPSPDTHGSLSAAAGTCASVSYTPAPTATTSFVDPLVLGHVLIHKTAGDTGVDQAGASFTITPGKVTAGGTNASDSVPGVVGQAGWYCVDNLRLSSTFSVQETAAPAGYSVPSPDTHGSLSAAAGTCASVSYTPAPTATTSFVDPPSLGYVLVKKTAGDSGALQAGASFTISPGKVTAAGTNASDSVAGVVGQAGWYCVDNLRLSSTFSVQETAAPAGYDLPSPTSHGSLSATAGTCASVSYTPAPTATTSFVDPLSLGYVLVKKTAGDSGALQPGASFNISPGKVVGATTDPLDPVMGVTGHDGYYCIDNLRLSSTFTVTETAAPAGYNVPNPAAHPNLSATAGSCSDVSYAPTPPAGTTQFVDPLKLGFVLVHKTAADGGADQAGATFVITPGQVSGGGANASDTIAGVAGQPGYYCIDNLRFTSTFSVQETVAPPGYNLPSPATHSGLSPTSGSCANATYTDAASTTSFTDPLKVGYVLVHKTAGDTGFDQAGATFTIAPGQVNGSGTNAGGTLAEVGGHPGYYCIDNLRVTTTTFQVTETAAPAGYDIPNPATKGPFTPTEGTCAGISFASAPTAHASFVDPLAVGAIVITKKGKDKSCIAAGNPAASCSAASTRLLANAVFELRDAATGTSVKYTSGSTAADGTVCISGIVPGAYTLHEKTAPGGYAAGANATVNITGDTTCAGTGAAAPTLATVIDQPLTTITVSATPVNSGATQSTVQCTGESDAAPVPHTTGTYVPGTYTCTVIIDP